MFQFRTASAAASFLFSLIIAVCRGSNRYAKIECGWLTAHPRKTALWTSRRRYGNDRVVDRTGQVTQFPQ